MGTQNEGQENVFAGLCERAWNDEQFMALLESDTNAAISEYLGSIPSGFEFRVVRDTDKVKHLHIPAAPSEGEISEHDLASAHGGTTWDCIASGARRTVQINIGTIDY
ncbi:hypothetical protein [Ruegeria jejuensis]|uniref:hypothetical protein n=1 Tax=Ruegeria jejuensis TaxID=3233338 RepID=UPI00355C210F